MFHLLLQTETSKGFPVKIRKLFQNQDSIQLKYAKNKQIKTIHKLPVLSIAMDKVEKR